MISRLEVYAYPFSTNPVVEKAEIGVITYLKKQKNKKKTKPNKKNFEKYSSMNVFFFKRTKSDFLFPDLEKAMEK